MTCRMESITIEYIPFIKLLRADTVRLQLCMNYNEIL